ASAEDDVYLVGGRSKIFHSVGDGNWTLQALATDGGSTYNADVYSIWGNGPKDLYVPGDHYVLHSQGDGIWVPEALGMISAYPTAVWGSGPSDVYVVTGGDFFPSGDILHSDGKGAWVPLRFGDVPSLYYIWGSGPDDIYAVGAKGTILHSQ